jgi:multidrug resistance efflux pump
MCKEEDAMNREQVELHERFESCLKMLSGAQASLSQTRDEQEHEIRRLEADVSALKSQVDSIEAESRNSLDALRYRSR